MNFSFLFLFPTITSLVWISYKSLRNKLSVYSFLTVNRNSKFVENLTTVRINGRSDSEEYKEYRDGRGKVGRNIEIHKVSGIQV